MKHIVLLSCLLILTWCSLTWAPVSVVTDTGSTNTWAQIIETNTWSDLMSGEDLVISGSTIMWETNTWSESQLTPPQLITNNEWDIIFQKYDWDKYDLPKIWMWPLFVLWTGNIYFTPDIIINKIQRLNIDNNMSLYIKIGDIYWDYNEMREFALNVWIIKDWTENFTKSFTWVYNRLWWYWPADYFYTQKLNNLLFINQYSFPQILTKIVNLNINQEIKEDKLINAIEQKEKLRNKNIFCWKNWDAYKLDQWKITIAVNKAKTECAWIPKIGDEFETAIYQRNPENNTFTFLRTEPISNQ